MRTDEDILSEAEHIDTPNWSHDIKKMLYLQLQDLLDIRDLLIERRGNGQVNETAVHEGCSKTSQGT